jgi:hypothetical protein
MADERFQELLSLYVDGRTTPEQLAELEAELARDPSLRALFVERIRQHVDLQTLAESAVEEVRARPAARPGARRGARWRGAARDRSLWAIALAAAAVLLGLVGLFLSSSPAPERRRGVEQADRGSAEAEAARERRGIEARVQEPEAKEAERVLRSRGNAPGEDRRPVAEENEKALEERKRARQAEEERLARLRKAEEEARGTPAPPLPPAPVEDARPAPRTQVAVAKLERIEGDVTVRRGGESRAVQAGDPLLPGDEVRAGGAAVLSFPDGTSIEVSGEAELRDLRAEGGKRMTLAKGILSARVARQPAGQPLLIATPHGEARVLGTTLRLVVEPGEDGSTRLEVTEGKVQLRNRAGRSVDVPAGHFAVASVAPELAARPLPVDEILLLPAQGKRTGGEWRLAKDPAGREVLEVPGVVNRPFPTAKLPNYLRQFTSYVTFMFAADADRDYHVWIRGECPSTASRVERDAVALEALTGDFTAVCPWFGPAGQRGFMFDYFSDFAGQGWVGGGKIPNSLTDVVTAVRFARAGTQTLRLYAVETPMRVSAIWLSATQKTRPAAETTGPHPQGR